MPPNLPARARGDRRRHATLVAMTLVAMTLHSPAGRPLLRCSLDVPAIGDRLLYGKARYLRDFAEGQFLRGGRRAREAFLEGRLLTAEGIAGVSA